MIGLTFKRLLIFKKNRVYQGLNTFHYSIIGRNNQYLTGAEITTKINQLKGNEFELKKLYRSY